MKVVKNVISLQIFKFIFVGLISALFEFAAFILLADFFKINIMSANVISITGSLLINYILSKYFVFEQSKHSRIIEILFFIILSIITLILNNTIFFILVFYLKINTHLAKAFAIGTVAVFNYLSKKYIVFKV